MNKSLQETIIIIIIIITIINSILLFWLIKFDLEQHKLQNEYNRTDIQIDNQTTTLFELLIEKTDDIEKRLNKSSVKTQ